MRGTERVAWNQDAGTLAAAQALSFVIYIDDRRNDLPGASCVESAGAIECSAPIPRMSNGRHTLQIAAVSAGREGTKSDTITIDYGATASSADDASSLAVPAPGADVSSHACTSEPVVVCFDVETIAEGLLAPSDLIALEDGRLLWLEGGRSVVIASGDSRQVAFDVADTRDGNARLVAAAIDPAFSSTHRVYLALLAPAAPGASTLSILQLREVGGRLGEAQIVLPGMPVPNGVTPTIVAGPGETVYLALPSAEVAGRSREAATLSRFEPSDGGLRLTSAQPTPVSQPGRLTWDGHRLWLPERAARAGAALAGVTSPQDGSIRAVRSLEDLPAGPIAGVREIVLVPGPAPESSTSDAFFVTADGAQLFGATVAYGADGTPRIVAAHPLAIGDRTVSALTVTATRDLFALVTPAGSTTTSILRLRPATK